MQYDILIFLGNGAWLTAPFHSTGLYGNYPPPETDYKVDAQGLDLDEIKQAIAYVDTPTALENLSNLGATLLIATPQFSRRHDD